MWQFFWIFFQDSCILKRHTNVTSCHKRFLKYLQKSSIGISFNNIINGISKNKISFWGTEKLFLILKWYLKQSNGKTLGFFIKVGSVMLRMNIKVSWSVKKLIFHINAGFDKSCRLWIKLTTISLFVCIMEFGQA